jgi:deoxyadenosine/deoxycytidine kinase
MNKGLYIIVCGSIGVGKTTLSNLLSRNIPKSEILPEERSIFLEDFYLNPAKYAFKNQLAYSVHYLEQASVISKNVHSIIQDRSIYDTHQVFSTQHFNNHLISAREFVVLSKIFQLSRQFATPDLLVFLRCNAEIAFNRVQRRGIKEEAKVSLEYLKELDTSYAKWFSEFNYCEKVEFNTDVFTAEDICQKIITDTPKVRPLIHDPI